MCYIFILETQDKSRFIFLVFFSKAHWRREFKAPPLGSPPPIGCKARSRVQTCSPRRF